MKILHNLHDYNNTYGWEEGNLVLINLAQEINEKYKTQMIFRVHGDKFIVLYSSEDKIEQNEFNLPKELNISVKNIDLNKKKISSFEKLLPFIYKKNDD